MSSTNTKIIQSPSTHKCMQCLLVFGQILGTCAVQNIRSENPSNLCFKWRSWRVLYSIILCCAHLVSASLSFYKALTEGIFLNQLITPLFYIHTFLTGVLFLKISMNWPKFMIKWSKFEAHFLKRYKGPTNLCRQVNIGASIMFLVAITEHGLAVNNSVQSSNCQNDSTGMERYLKKQFHFIFRYIPYSPVVGIAMIILVWTGILVWNFGDIFIVLISVIMRERFKQITQRVRRYLEDINAFQKPQSIMGNFIKVYQTDFSKADYKFWKEIREDYDRMSQTIDNLNIILADLILLTYSCNLTFILIQLFNSLRQMESVSEGVYFFFSFGFVIARIVVVSIFGASINEESQAIAPYLNTIPTEIYNEEIQRLITQVQIDTVALTGHNFFRITKGLVLSVAAAIITYELVLIQFNQTTLDKYMMSSNQTICL